MVPELMAYMGIIVRASQDYAGLGWVRYDSAFRHQAAFSGNKQWTVVNGTLFTLNFAGRPTGMKRCELCHATSHSESECTQNGNPDPDLGDRMRSLELAVLAITKRTGGGPSVPGARSLPQSSGDICRKWNTTGCAFLSCRHLHVCGTCRDSHPAS